MLIRWPHSNDQAVGKISISSQAQFPATTQTLRVKGDAGVKKFQATFHSNSDNAEDVSAKVLNQFGAVVNKSGEWLVHARFPIR